MPQDHWSPGAEEVEVAVSVCVEEVRSLGVGHEGWIAAYGTECSDRRVNASGEEFFGSLLQMAGASEGAGHVFKYRSVRLDFG